MLALIFDGIGVGEWFVLLAVILVVVGPKRLPSTARKFGQYYAKFRRAAESFKRQIMDMDTEFTSSIKEAAAEMESAAAEIESAANGAMEELQDFPVPPSDYEGSAAEEPTGEVESSTGVETEEKVGN